MKTFYDKHPELNPNFSKDTEELIKKSDLYVEYGNSGNRRKSQF